MKANELMIGDWVEFVSPDGQGFYAQVEALNDDGTFSEGGFFEDNMVRPIPLTHEILEKNGMVGLCGSNWPSSGHPSIELTSTMDGELLWTINCNEYEIMSFKYVHELQHALKICGVEKEIEL